MRGAILPLPQYAFITWYSVKESTGTTLPLPLTFTLLIAVSRRTRRVEHVQRMGEVRSYTKFWSENKGRDYSEDLGVDGSF
jgi:hypothetical protein